MTAPVDEAAVVAAEAKLGLSLPLLLRAVYTRIGNGGWCLRLMGLDGGQTGFDDIGFRRKSIVAARRAMVRRWLKAFGKPWPEHLVPISDASGCGMVEHVDCGSEEGSGAPTPATSRRWIGRSSTTSKRVFPARAAAGKCAEKTGDGIIIRISGSARITHDDSEEPLVEEALVRELDGATSTDTCVHYLENDRVDPGLTGGTVRLVWSAETGSFLVVTEYVAPGKLTAPRARRLVEETTGQWSDGIGESCFDDLADLLEITIDLSPDGQRATIE